MFYQVPKKKIGVTAFILFFSLYLNLHVTVTLTKKWDVNFNESENVFAE